GGAPQDRGEIDGLHADSERLQQLFAVARGVEVVRTSADRAQARVAHPLHNAADGDEIAQVRLERLGIRADGVLLRHAEGETVLVEIVADGDLATERV